MRLLAFVLLAAPFAGCLAPETASPTGVPPEAEAPRPDGPAAPRSPDLDAARQRWADAGLDAYRMTLQRSCFCPEDYRGPFEVTVRDGAVASARFDGATVDPERVVTVDGLFGLIEDAYERGAERVDVTFDPELGYPTELYIDVSSQMADEEVGYTVSDLRVAER